MRLRNILAMSLFIVLAFVFVFACTSFMSYDGPESGAYVAFDYPVPNGMIENAEEKEAMIQAKIENLEETNKIFWGRLPNNKDVVLTGFHAVWQWIRVNYPGFPGLEVDWDEIGRQGYEELENIDNYGQFIYWITRLGLMLQEGHVGVSSDRMDGINWRNSWRKHTPIIRTNPLSRIGACYTVTNFRKEGDPGNFIVYKLLYEDDNPYELRVGDEIVGFNGIHWSEWYPRLLEAKIPVDGSAAANDDAIAYAMLRSGMWNAYLFEKINVKRFDTGKIDTYNIVTRPYRISEIKYCEEYFGNIDGIKFPRILPLQFDTMTYGVDENNIGIMHVTECPSGFEDFDDAHTWNAYETMWSREFEQAVDDLIDRDVKGLILDIRLNFGGRNETFYKGFAKLIGAEEDLDMFNMLVRDEQDPSIYALEEAGFGEASLPAHENMFKKPIVVLTGPQCISACDFLNGFFAKVNDHIPYTFYTMGLSHNGSFMGVSGNGYDLGEDIVWLYIPSQAGAYLDEIQKDENGDLTDYRILIRRDFVQEKIWQTKQDVLRRRDTVRERAIEYILNDPRNNKNSEFATYGEYYEDQLAKAKETFQEWIDNSNNNVDEPDVNEPDVNEPDVENNENVTE